MKRFRLSSSVLMATAVVAITTAWMLSGVGGESSGNEPVDPRRGNTVESATAASGSAAPQRAPMRVSVQHSEARTITREVTVSGRTEPNRSVEIKAETEGRVVEIGADRGSRVARRRAHRGTRRTRSPGENRRSGSVDRTARAAVPGGETARGTAAHRRGADRGGLCAARRRTRHARADSARPRADGDLGAIRRPAGGPQRRDRRLRRHRRPDRQDRRQRPADFGRRGQRARDRRAVDRQRRDARSSSAARSSKASCGTSRRSRTRAHAPSESSSRCRTRTAALPAGLTAQLRLPAAEIEAHFLSPALLTLDDAGNIGVKVVDERNKVQVLRGRHRAVGERRHLGHGSARRRRASSRSARASSRSAKSCNRSANEKWGPKWGQSPGRGRRGGAGARPRPAETPEKGL
jgi:membrane fusion protein, multidrug efflux system